jgi:PilZ domain
MVIPVFVTTRPMTEERRRQKRYTIDCPVTVQTPGRGKKHPIGHGWLCDISDKGARFRLDHPMQVGSRISLDVHFSNPNHQVTTIRFPGIVKRVSQDDAHEAAIVFLKGTSFIRNNQDSFHKGLQQIHINEHGKWIN